MRRGASFVALSRVVWLLILSLAAAGVLVQVWPERLDVSVREPLIAWFDLGREGSVGNWLSALLLGTSGLLALLNGGRGTLRGKDRRFWHWLGYILLFLSLDEAIALHEQVNEWMGESPFGLDLTVAWVVPWGAFVLVVALIYWRFLARQDDWLRRRVVMAGALYVFSALIVRFTAETFAAELGQVGYQLAVVGQEIGEMVAIAWFAITVLRWTTDGSPAVAVD